MHPNQNLHIRDMLHCTSMFISKHHSKIITGVLALTFLFPLAFANFAIAQTTTGLIAHWKLDEASGNSAFDSSGNGNTATLKNGAYRTTGFSGAGVGLDGLNDYISVGSNSSVRVAEQFSFTAWVAPQGIRSSFFARGSDISFELIPSNGRWVLRSYATAANGTAKETLLCATNIVDGKWHHVALTYDLTTWNAYVDGRLDCAGTGVAGTLRASNVETRIAAIPIGAFSFYAGRIDEIRLYKRALSAGEIQGLAGVVSSTSDTTAPTVSITAPANGTIVFGTKSITANAADNVGVAGVQFKLDGVNLGAEDSNAPYTIMWDTTTAGNGSHMLTAVASDTAGNQTISSAVTVTVNNTVAFDFSISNAGNRTVTQGQSVSNTLTATLSTGAAQTLSFSTSGLPSGATASFSPTHCTPTCSTTMTMTTTAVTPTGTYTVTVSGTGGGVTKTSGFTLTVAASTPSPTAGLIAYYKFDEGSGTTAFDSSGNGRTATLKNGPTWTAGKIGQALDFDGVDDMVETLLSDTPAQITLAAWVAPASTGENNDGSIIQKQHQTDTYGIFELRHTFGKLRFQRGWTSITGTWDTTNPVGIDNTWRQVVVTYNGSSALNEAIFYVNGMPIASTNTTQPAGSLASSGHPFIIGNRADGTRTYDGKIDDVRIYNRVLTASEIQVLYNEGQQGGTPSPIPTLSLSATPASTTAGGSTTLTWTSQNATSCSAAWTTATGVSGSQTVTPAQTTTYSLTCTGAGGSVTQQTTVTVTTPSPSTQFSLNNRVQVQTIGGSNLNIYATAYGTFLGSQPNGALGTVIGGPVLANGIWWWNVNYDTGVDGWSQEQFLVQTATQGFFQQYSTWYQKIPTAPQVMDNSQNYVQDILVNGSGVAVEYREWSVPIFYAKADTPIVTVATGNQNTIANGWNKVPIPPEAVPAGNSASLAGQYRDGHLSVVSHDRKFAWDFFGAQKATNDNWSASMVRRWDLSTDGVMQEYDLQGSPRACPTSLLHGLITKDEIKSGRIDHALAFAYWGAPLTAHWDIYPCRAYRQGVSTRPWAMLHGFRLQLDPSVDINTLGLNAAGRVVAKALQEYGAIFVENAGQGSNIIYAESFEDKPESWGADIPLIAGIPLNRFRVIEPLQPQSPMVLSSPTSLTVLSQ